MASSWPCSSIAWSCSATRLERSTSNTRSGPWPLAPDDFDPRQMQRGVPGGAGCQRFFLHEGRPLCLYAAIGSFKMRTVLVREINKLLETFDISPR